MQHICSNEFSLFGKVKIFKVSNWSLWEKLWHFVFFERIKLSKLRLSLRRSTRWKSRQTTNCICECFVETVFLAAAYNVKVIIAHTFRIKNTAAVRCSNPVLRLGGKFSMVFRPYHTTSVFCQFPSSFSYLSWCKCRKHLTWAIITVTVNANAMWK